MDFGPESSEFQRLPTDRNTLDEDPSVTLQPSAGDTSTATSSFATGPEGSSSNVASTSGNIEFTKRKNWSQQMVEELKDFLHVISTTGKIMYCSPSSTEIVGYSPEELVNRIITDFIHVDDIDMFVRDFNNAMRLKTNFTIYYRFRRKDDKFVILEVNGQPYFGENNSMENCKCFFNIARVYPSKTAVMLDTFLELKVENEYLRRQLHDLLGPPEITAEGSGSAEATTSEVVLPSEGSAMEEMVQGTTNPINLLTGLRYDEGEYAKGISTGSKNPSLLNESSMDIDKRDDSSSTITTSTDSTSQAVVTPSPSKKKKKLKKDEEEYVCTDCGTVESPEWRKGPLGPKT
ncbi:6293_t:CDS:2, partial [Acaulospora colombiana]